MQLRLVKTLLWLLSILPLRLNHAIGAFIGLCNWWLPTRNRTATRVNLALCFPEATQQERRNLGRQSLIETGKAMTELGWIWHRSAKELNAKIRNVHGQTHLDLARQQKKGLIIVSPHLGSWEFCTVPLAWENRPVFMYRPPRRPFLEPLMISARTRFGAELASVDAAGIKHVIRSLREGRCVGILPDQEPDRANGVFAPFFGVEANTMTLLSRLSSSAEIGLVMMYCERLPHGQGYDVHYLPADEAIRHKDKTNATRALNASLERCILQCKHQYIWSYKRFRLQPDGSRRKYR
ncbi:MAG: lysophospholipid acyltransferase family protein [Granulosicoccus sp.]|nr:lysophospholipid acyltransferase family protein [Granulosicoccus sp.]